MRVVVPIRRLSARSVGLAAVVLAVAVATILVIGRGGSGLSRKQVLTYHEKLLPLVTEWGKIEIQGMRPAIADLDSGEGVPAEMIAGEARAWTEGLEELREKIRRLPAPGSLGRANRLFDESIVFYIDAARTFERAALGPAQDRAKGVDKGVHQASEGARVYNKASMVLQAARRSVGLPTSSDFPDHPAGEQKVE